MDITSFYTSMSPNPSPHSKVLTREMAVAFANIFMAKIQMQILGKGAYLEMLHWLQNLSVTCQQISCQPLLWKSKLTLLDFS